MNIPLNSHFEAFVAKAVESGRFKSSSEVVREALRLLEERETRISALKREIEIGRSSCQPVPFDPEAVKRRGRAALKAGRGKAA